jgi:arylformamidase
MSDWIDITVPVHPGMAHWPGDRAFQLRSESRIAAGDVYNLSSFSMSAHTGTHMDAPLHFLDGAASLDELPFGAVMGPARVVAIEHPHRIPIEEVRACNVQPGERILFKTANSKASWHDRPFEERFIAIRADTAAHLAERRPVLIGVDYLSVGAFEGDGVETHRLLLGAGIWLVEGLDLTHVDPGAYELVCLPMRIAGIEGAPARAALRRI